MIVSIGQPAYLPWLGYFERIARSDLHVVLDHVPMDHSSRTKFANRNKVRTADGWCWLTVPVLTKGDARHLPLAELEIVNDTEWTEKHWRTLAASYARAAHFAEHADFFHATYETEWQRLVPLCSHVTGYLLDAFGIATPLVRSSELAAQGAKDELLVAICRDVGATTYLSGPFGRDYIRPELFEAAGIGLAFHEFEHPVYEQAFPGFEPFMSAIDLLFNRGTHIGRGRLAA
jgi:hypothetical protein